MTTVYLVYEGRYDDRDVVAVHRTEEGAKAEHRRRHAPKWRETTDGLRCGHSIPADELPIAKARYCTFAIRREALEP